MVEDQLYALMIWQIINHTFGDVAFGVVFTNAFLCIEGETSELRFVFLEIFAFADPLVSSTRHMFLTKRKVIKIVMIFLPTTIMRIPNLGTKEFLLTLNISWSFLLHVCTSSMNDFGSTAGGGFEILVFLPRWHIHAIFYNRRKQLHVINF